MKLERFAALIGLSLRCIVLKHIMTKVNGMEQGGGVLLNQVAHQLDLLQWITGVPKSVYTKVKFGSHCDIVVEDKVTAIMEYQNGATGVFVTSTHDLTGTNRLEIGGDKGKIIV